MEASLKAKNLYHQIETMFEISDSITRSSKHFSEEEKEWRYNSTREDRVSLEKFNNEYKEHYNSTSLRAFASGFLIYWNEAVGIDVERFWKEASIQNIEFKRVEPLRYALKSGHFRNIHVIMSARRHWQDLMESDLISEKYSIGEIHSLKSIMENDEQTRIELIRKFMKNRDIHIGNAMKLYDSLEYFQRFDLFTKYLSVSEVDELNRIKMEYEIRHITSDAYKQGNQDSQ